MRHTYPLATTRLDNGLRVAVSPDPWVSGVAVNLWYGVGSAHETAGKTGFAHLFEHLMFSGSAQVAPGEFDSLLQAIGGSSNASTSFDATTYYELVPQTGLELALWLEADRLSSLLDRVDEGNLATQREVVKEEKRQRYDNVPYGDAFERIMGLAFPSGHPYAHLPIGSMDDLDRAELADVQDFFHRFYAPDNLVLTLTGAVTAEEGIDLVERHFGAIASPGTPPDPAVDALPPLTGSPRVTAEAEVPQDAVYCCWLVPPVADDSNDPLNLGLTVLAGSMTSRLYQAVVRTGLADSVDVFDMGLARGNSLVVASAACAESVTPEALEEAMMTAWDRFVRQGPTEAELERAKKAEDRDYLLDCAHIRSRADHICAAWDLFGQAEEFNRHLDAIHALTPGQVAEEAGRWLRPENRAVLTYRRPR